MFPREYSALFFYIFIEKKIIPICLKDAIMYLNSFYLCYYSTLLDLIKFELC